MNNAAIKPGSVFVNQYPAGLRRICSVRDVLYPKGAKAMRSLPYVDYEILSYVGDKLRDELIMTIDQLGLILESQ